MSTKEENITLKIETGIVRDGFCQTIQVYISLDSKIYFWKKTKKSLDLSKIHRNISEQPPYSYSVRSRIPHRNSKILFVLSTD